MLNHQDMSLFKETLLPTMVNSVVPNDLRDAAKLCDKTAKLKLKTISGQNKSHISKEMAKNEYVLFPNDARRPTAMTPHFSSVCICD